METGSIGGLPAWIEPRAQAVRDDFQTCRDDFEAELAPLIHRWARTACAPGCRDYHGLWPYVKPMAPGLGIGGDAPALAAAYRGLSEAGALGRVLLCGAADHLMLALLAHALDGRPWPAVTVLDLCDTPLLANRWYAARRGLAIETVRADARDPLPAGAYDLITTHYFLDFLDEPGRRVLAATWAAGLAPGGCIVLANRIRPDGRGGGAGGGRGPGRRAAYEAAMERAAGAIGRVEMAPDALAAALDRLTMSGRADAVRSLDALTAPFRAAGLTIEVATRIERAVDHAVDPGAGAFLLVARRPPA